MFREPYNSTEIGFHRVGVVSLDPEFITPHSVHSKCLIIPATVKSGTKNDPDERFMDPVPQSVLNMMIPRKIVGPLRLLSPAERAVAMSEAYNKAFAGVDIDMLKWSIISIMRPGSNV